jgi:hypothetical protein
MYYLDCITTEWGRCYSKTTPLSSGFVLLKQPHCKTSLNPDFLFILFYFIYLFFVVHKPIINNNNYKIEMMMRMEFSLPKNPNSFKSTGHELLQKGNGG